MSTSVTARSRRPERARSRKASASAAGPRISRTHPSTTPCTSRIRRPFASSTGCCTRTACCSAAPAASMLPPPCVSPAGSAAGIPSLPCCATAEPSTSRASSIANGWSRRDSRPMRRRRRRDRRSHWRKPLSPEFPWLIAVGFVAQLIDGCVGMGYGISSSAILATLGVPPAITSATVHAAEVVTAGVSSASHAWFRNIDRKIFFSLLVPGVIGGVLGATVLALATSLTLWYQLGQMRYDMVVALLIGGAAAAPLAAWVTRHVPQRAAATAVGVVVFALGATGLFATLT